MFGDCRMFGSNFVEFGNIIYKTCNTTINFSGQFFLGLLFYTIVELTLRTRNNSMIFTFFYETRKLVASFLGYYRNVDFLILGRNPRFFDYGGGVANFLGFFPF